MPRKTVSQSPSDGDTDERVKRSKEVVLKATFQLLTELGLGGVSVDAVSRQCGVAKTTIYRHWPTRSALLLDACAQMSTRPQAPDTGSFKGDLTPLIMRVASQMATARWATALPSIIDAAERDAELAEVQTRTHGAMRDAFRVVIERAQARNEISRKIDPSDLIASILGPLFYRRFISREPLDERFVKNLLVSIVGK